MGAFVLAALALQAAEADDAAIRRFAALLSQPASRPRGFDRLSHVDPKILRRLEIAEPDLLKAAEENMALRPSYGPPRLFSLDGHEEELDDVLIRFERASGLVFHRTSLPRGVKIALRLEDASIFEALVELGRVGGFTLLGAEGGQLYLQPGLPSNRPRAFLGPVMVELERMSLRTRVGFDATTREFWARLAVWWEPHVLPFEGPLACVVTRAVDDAGRSLLSTDPTPAAPRVDPYPRAGHRMAVVEGLRAPAPDARTLTLEGAVELRFPERVDVATFEKPGVVERPGVRIELKSLTAAATGGTTAEIRLRFEDRARALEYKPSAADLTFDSDVPATGALPSLVVLPAKDNDVEFTVRASGLRRVEDVNRVHVRVPRGSVVKRVPFRFEGVDLK